ncbi:hypothetical protein EYZ11_007792 [Aspergillus tanneri]|uniref:Arsenosugar biosynthesis radical SAM protein ArsS-like C-terminal domain-containing protein n=1 Tax=Aspergillus tanneri TaxID=1220188 RepID=A0A4V6RQS2_9EURO|nr:hypothetical protein EYZ11_007792 [Aspergillus tanneri]
MPIKRFADTLLEKGEYAAYMELLANSFNISTVDRLMCRYTVNVSWDGDLYDCDFNSALQMGSKGVGQVGNLNIWQIESLTGLKGGYIRTEKHCFGCTAGSGSSCSGALT